MGRRNKWSLCGFHCIPLLNNKRLGSILWSVFQARYSSMLILILDIYCISGMCNTWNLVSILCINIKYSYKQNTCMESYASSEMCRTICPESRVKLYQMWTMQSFIMRALLAISSKPSQFYCAKWKENNNLETNTNIFIERLNRHGLGRHRASRRSAAPRAGSGRRRR